MRSSTHPGIWTVARPPLRGIASHVLQEIETCSCGCWRRAVPGEIAAEDAAKRLRQVHGRPAQWMVATAGSASHFPAADSLPPGSASRPGIEQWLPAQSQSHHQARRCLHLRTLLIHGARSVLARAKQVNQIDPTRLSRLQQWGLQLQHVSGTTRPPSPGQQAGAYLLGRGRTRTRYEPGYGA